MIAIPSNPFSGTTTLLLILTACSITRAEGPTAPRPNILFLYADDLGYGDLACYGSPVAKTANLDRLADEGTRFTQFYVSHCVCSPTRCSAITGHYPSRHGIHAHLSYLNSNRRRHMPNFLDPSAPSLPRALQSSGYRTAMIGKWHLGGGSGRKFRGQAVNDPNAPPVADYGFDHVRTTFGNSPTWRNAEPHLEPHDIYPYEDRGWQRWSSRAVADETIQFLEDHARNHQREPFYVNVWFKDVHTPFNPTAEMLQTFEALPEPSRTHYAMVHFMDTQIGRVLSTLDQLGFREQTLVIFSSDNGAAKGRGGSNGPLRKWKWYLYEGGIRVPLIVRWPGRVVPGRTDEDSVLNIVDFLPTFCRLAAASMPEGYNPDGLDITEALEGRSFQREQPLFWHHPTSPEGGPTLAVRDGDWKLLMKPDGNRPELYDLTVDPAEQQNLVRRDPDLAERMKKSLLTWYRTLPQPYGD